MDYNSIKKKYIECIKDMEGDLKINIDNYGNRDYYTKVLQYTMNIDVPFYSQNINSIPDISFKDRNTLTKLVTNRENNYKYISDRIGDTFYIFNNKDDMPLYFDLYNTIDTQANIIKNDILTKNIKQINSLSNLKEVLDILKKNNTYIDKLDQSFADSTLQYNNFKMKILFNFVILLFFIIIIVYCIFYLV
jgi:protease II